MRNPALALIPLAASALALGCSSTPPGGAGDSGGGGSCTPACGTGWTCQNGQCVNAGGDGGLAQDGGGQQGSDGGSWLNDAGIDVCQAVRSKGKKQPLDMYIMLDHSTSMGDPLGTSGTKWEAIAAALNSFLGQTGMEGISVGLQYFPLGSRSSYCTVSNYSTPEVEIAPIAQSGSAITQSIANQDLASYTPTSAALTGAIEHAQNWASNHPEDVAVVVLATDGEPTACERDIDLIADIAAAGVSGTPKIQTFVIGVGASLDNLNAIAAGGGTTSAFLVTGGDVGAQFLQALNQIRGAATACTYLLEAPDGQVLDPAKVNVEYKQGGTTSVTLVQVQDQSSCAASQDAWYYDNPSTPSKILLCPATCTKVEQDANAEINVLLGCKTIGPT